MFEQSVVHEGQSGRRSAATLPLSIALHAVAFTTAAFAAVWQVDFPKRSPDQAQELIFQKVPDLPPSSGGQPEKKRLVQTTEKPHVADADTPPTVIPNDVKPADPLPGTNTTTNPDEGDPNASGQGDPNSIGDGPGIGPGTSTTPTEEPVLMAGGDVKAPEVLRKVEPTYPRVAVTLRKEGVVVLQAIIDRNGELREIEVLRSPHESLSAAAVQSVSQWRFRPGTLHGNAVNVRFVLTVNFSLKR